MCPSGVDGDAAWLLEAEHIVKTYVKPGSEYEINISSAQMHRCLKVRLCISTHTYPFTYICLCVCLCLCLSVRIYVEYICR